MHEQQASGKTSVTLSLCGEMEAWLLRRHEGTTRQGRVLPSEEGAWAEGRPVLCLWSQGDSISLATCPKGRRACPQVPYPELAETTPWRNGQSDAVFHQDVAALWVAGGVPGKERRPSPTVPNPSARAVCRDPVASSLLW